MKKGRRSPEQIIRILRSSEGMKVEDACREHGMSTQTYYRWKEKYGNMGVKEAQRLKDLEKESDQLKKIVADQLLQIKALEIALEKNV